MDKWLPAIIGSLLTTGGLAFVTNFFRGFGSIRTGVRAREKEAVDDLGDARRNAERDRDYWRTTAHRYIGQLVRAGIEPDPADPVAPSERDGEPPRRRRPRGTGKHALPDVERE